MDEHRNLWSPPVTGSAALTPIPPIADVVPSNLLASTGTPSSLTQPMPRFEVETATLSVEPSPVVIQMTPQMISEAAFASSSYTAPTLLSGESSLPAQTSTVDQMIAANQPRVRVSDHSGEGIEVPKMPRLPRMQAFSQKHRESIIVAGISLLIFISGAAFITTQFGKSNTQTVVTKTQPSGGGTAAVDAEKKLDNDSGTLAEDVTGTDDTFGDEEESVTISEDEDIYTEDNSSEEYIDEEIYEEISEEDGEDEAIDNSTTVVTSPPPTAVPTTPAPTQAHKFTIASWNTSSTNKSNVGDQVASLMKSTQVIALQELHEKTQRDRVKSKVLCSSCAYKGYLPSYNDSGASTASYPIIWNKSAFTQVGNGTSRKMCDAAKTSSYSYAARYATWARLKSNVNGKQFYVVSTHFMDGEGDRGKPTKDTLLTARYKTHMSNLVKLIKELQAANIPVYVAGTFNVDYRYDRTIKTAHFPYQNLRSVNIFSNWELLNLSGISSSASSTGSSGRIAHYVFTWKRNDVTPNSIAVSGSRFGSNSSPVYFTSTIK